MLAIHYRVLFPHEKKLSKDYETLGSNQLHSKKTPILLGNDVSCCRLLINTLNNTRKPPRMDEPL